MVQLFWEVGPRPKPLIANICSEELAAVHLALKGKQKSSQPPSNSSFLQNNRFGFAEPQISPGCTPAAGRRHGNHSKSTEQIVTPAESPERGVPGRAEERRHHISTNTENTSKRAQTQMIAAS